MKKQEYHLTNKNPYNQETMIFPVVMYGCKSSNIKRAECQRTDAFILWCWRRLLKVPWTTSQGDQPWIFTGSTHVWSCNTLTPDVKGWLIEKDLDAGKDQRQKENRVAEDEMVRQHHQLNGHESEQTPGDSDGQGSLVCRSTCGHKELDTI